MSKELKNLDQLPRDRNELKRNKVLTNDLELSAVTCLSQGEQDFAIEICPSLFGNREGLDAFLAAHEAKKANKMVFSEIITIIDQINPLKLVWVLDNLQYELDHDQSSRAARRDFIK